MIRQSSVRFANSPFAKGAFWPVRSRAPSEYEARWSSPRPNAPFLKGGGSAQALTGDCRTPRRFGKHTLPAVYPALAEVRTILSHGLRHDSPTVRNGCADKTILNPLRGQLLCQRSLLFDALPHGIRIRKTMEFIAPKSSLLKGGWRRRKSPPGDCRILAAFQKACRGGLAYSSEHVDVNSSKRTTPA